MEKKNIRLVVRDRSMEGDAVVGWIDLQCGDTSGCHPACKQGLAAGKPVHLIPRFGEALDTYHFATVDEAVEVLLTVKGGRV